ncbi:MAG: hypothetical protein H7A33_06785 [Deltaproteobacteria bacterium]|nr:hypothetical protein [Deltaproteobacteria bacterium]
MRHETTIRDAEKIQAVVRARLLTSNLGNRRVRKKESHGIPKELIRDLLRFNGQDEYIKGPSHMAEKHTQAKIKMALKQLLKVFKKKS